MPASEWKANSWGKYHTLNVGQIGCLQIEHYVGTRGADDWYQIAWYESEDYTYGEGIRIVLDETFPVTNEGLEAAKKRAVEWAKELLQEAMDSLGDAIDAL